jgi:hypothetical protein
MLTDVVPQAQIHQTTKKPPESQVAFGVAAACHDLDPRGSAMLASGVVLRVLPGIDLFSQGATPQISSALQRFTSEFEMVRSGSTAPWTPG